jgi:polyisoprenoid-binding protein YceI
MKVKQLSVLLISLAMAVSTQVFAANYTIDTEGQHVAALFKANHLGFSYVAGRFNNIEGSFTQDMDNPSANKVSVVIVAKSIDTAHAERDKHLRSDDFFDVAKYPRITFENTSYTPGEDTDSLKGDLTIHGITREVDIAVKHVGEGEDPWGGYRSGFVGNVTINAADFGMPDWVGDVDVELVVEGIRN